MVTFQIRYYSQIKKLPISRAAVFHTEPLLLGTNKFSPGIPMVFGKILLMEKITNSHHLRCYWNPAVNFMGFQRPNFPPSTGWWVGPGLTHQTHRPYTPADSRWLESNLRIPWVPSFWTMVSPCSLEKMSRKGAGGVWKSPISVNELNTNRLNPSAEPLCWLEKAGGLGVDHQK